MDEILQSQAAIEQAKGILMERYEIDPEAAFAVLRRHSQHSNRKLRDIAAEFIRTRRLPPDQKGMHLHSV
ncbi:MAG: ANTAR domain-containing protein [Marmoricola sp.]